MNKILMIAVTGLTVISLAACGAKDDIGAAAGSSKAKAKSTAAAGKKVVAGYSKADFMQACETSMTAAQCSCYVDFYKSIGIKVTDLGDQEKITAAMTSLKPEDAMKAAKCMQ